MREGIRPYQEWFDEQRYSALANHKRAFLSFEDPIDLSPAFEGFRPWLKQMKDVFSNGFDYKKSHLRKQVNEQEKQKRAGGSASGVTSVAAPFDDETLGGHVDYSTIVESSRDLEGELEGLVIRYETPISVIQADG